MKKKIWTVVGCFAMVLVVAATSVGITLAALQGQVSSTFNISYTAKNVKAAVVGWLQTEVWFDYNNKSRAVCYIQPLSVDGKDFVEFTGDESGTLSKQFDPIDLDFQIDSKVVNDMKGTLLHEGIVTENEFQMSKLSFDGPRFNIFFAVINLDGDAELPVQCNIQNYTSSGDAEFELIYGPTDNEIFDHEFSDDLPVDDVVPTQSETMTFSQYAAELKQQLSSKWNGKFPYYYEKYVNGESAYFLDGNASNEFLAVIGTYIEKRFPGMYGLPSSIDTFRFLMSSVLQNAIKEVAFSGDISLTLGTF